MKRKHGPPGTTGINIKRLRELAGLTQVQLQDRSGVHHTVIARLESGRTQKADEATVERIAAALNVRKGELVEAQEQTGWSPVENALKSFFASGLAQAIGAHPDDEDIRWLRAQPGIFWLGCPPTDESIQLLILAHRKRRKQGAM